MKDHYKILGITPGSTQDEVKKAYRVLALRHHPDRNNGSRQSEEIFKEIAESYIILGDLSSRKVYDDWRHEQSKPAAERPESGNAMAVSFLMVFRNIRERVFNTGGTIDGTTLFEIINEVLSTENLNYLVSIDDITTNGLIIDELVIASKFLDDSSKIILYRKLIRLAHGDSGLREKVSVLSNIRYNPVKTPAGNDYSEDYAYLFVVFLIVLILFGVIMG
ncbi:J domain-containing protein [Flavobacterium sp. DGU11]|uniref:J domain-containing protein n=1 Tax=Flavobacterium arundinis TaxID=3139143 RepID=A0ABU9I1W3_9FLAO